MNDTIQKALARLRGDGTAVMRAVWSPHWVHASEDITLPLAALIEAAAKPGRHGHSHHCRICSSLYTHINEIVLHEPDCALVALCAAITGETR